MERCRATAGDCASFSYFQFSIFQFLFSGFELGSDFGLICGTRRGSLPLLPSGPGGVREHPSHRARSLTSSMLLSLRSLSNYGMLACVKVGRRLICMLAGCGVGAGLQSLCKNSIVVSFRGAVGDEESRAALRMLRARFLAEFTLSTQTEIPSLRSGQALRGVYPERQSEILRSAQNDKRRAQDDSEGLGMTALKCFHTDPSAALPALVRNPS